MSIVSEQAMEITRSIVTLQDDKPVTLLKPITTFSSEPTEGMKSVAELIHASIQEAKNFGVSPEKLAPLYNSLTKALEICAELKGDLDRSNKTLNIVKIDIKKEVEEYAKAIELSR